MLTINERVKALEDRQREIENAIKSAVGHLVRIEKQQPGETIEQYAERMRQDIKAAAGQLTALKRRGL